MSSKLDDILDTVDWAERLDEPIKALFLEIVGDNETAQLIRPVHPFQTDEDEQRAYKEAHIRDMLRNELRESINKL